jgi:hypothetical protein
MHASFPLPHFPRERKGAFGEKQPPIVFTFIAIPRKLQLTLTLTLKPRQKSRIRLLCEAGSLHSF